MITTITIIYLVSVIGAYKTFQKNFFEYNVGHFIFMITPIANSIIIIMGMFIWLTNDIDWNKFFNKF